MERGATKPDAITPRFFVIRRSFRFTAGGPCLPDAAWKAFHSQPLIPGMAQSNSWTVLAPIQLALHLRERNDTRTSEPLLTFRRLAREKLAGSDHARLPITLHA